MFLAYYQVNCDGLISNPGATNTCKVVQSIALKSTIKQHKAKE